MDAIDWFHPAIIGTGLLTFVGGLVFVVLLSWNPSDRRDSSGLRASATVIPCPAEQTGTVLFPPALVDACRSGLAEFASSPVTGLLPEMEPLSLLPQPFDDWEKLIVNMESLLVAGKFRQAVECLPRLPHPTLQRLPELRRAHLLLSMFAHAYFFATEDSVEDVDVLPDSVSEPLGAVANKLGLPLRLTHASFIQYNWRLLHADGLPQLGNLALLHTFVGGLRESRLLLGAVEADAHAGRAFPALILAQDALLEARALLRGMDKEHQAETLRCLLDVGLTSSLRYGVSSSRDISPAVRDAILAVLPNGPRPTRTETTRRVDVSATPHWDPMQRRVRLGVQLEFRRGEGVGLSAAVLTAAVELLWACRALNDAIDHARSALGNVVDLARAPRLESESPLWAGCPRENGGMTPPIRFGGTGGGATQAAPRAFPIRSPIPALFRTVAGVDGAPSAPLPTRHASFAAFLRDRPAIAPFVRRIHEVCNESPCGGSLLAALDDQLHQLEMNLAQWRALEEEIALAMKQQP